MEINEVKKDLYRSKNLARFSHYVSGNLYYTVDLADGTYQFPIATVEATVIEKEFEGGLIKVDSIKLSSDLGTTSFYNEIRGSELSRWISKAIEANEFIKID